MALGNKIVRAGPDVASAAHAAVHRLQYDEAQQRRVLRGAAAAAASAPAGPLRHPRLRKLVAAVYRRILPFVRPVFHRVRLYMNHPLHERLAHIESVLARPQPAPARPVARPVAAAEQPELMDRLGRLEREVRMLAPMLAEMRGQLQALGSAQAEPQGGALLVQRLLRAGNVVAHLESGPGLQPTASALLAANPDIGFVVRLRREQLAGRTMEGWLEPLAALGLDCRAIDPLTGRLAGCGEAELAARDGVDLFLARRGSPAWTGGEAGA